MNPLIERLNDRSDMVRTAIVQAMKSHQNLRRPEALPLLNRLIENKSIQKYSPGTLETAIEVVRLISDELL